MLRNYLLIVIVFFSIKNNNINGLDIFRDARSLANLIKSSLGSGILAVPLAFANSGWAVGIVGTIIIAFICGHCVHVFVSIFYAYVNYFLFFLLIYSPKRTGRRDAQRFFYVVSANSELKELLFFFVKL